MQDYNIRSQEKNLLQFYTLQSLWYLLKLSLVILSAISPQLHWKKWSHAHFRGFHYNYPAARNPRKQNRLPPETWSQEANSEREHPPSMASYLSSNDDQYLTHTVRSRALTTITQQNDVTHRKGQQTNTDQPASWNVANHTFLWSSLLHLSRIVIYQQYLRGHNSISIIGCLCVMHERIDGVSMTS